MVHTTWLQEQVLNERREHVPWLAVHNRANEVEAVGCGQGDNDITEGCVSLDETGRPISDQPHRYEKKTYWGKFCHPLTVCGTARYTVYPAHQSVMIAQKPNRIMASE